VTHNAVQKATKKYPTSFLFLILKLVGVICGTSSHYTVICYLFNQTGISKMTQDVSVKYEASPTGLLFHNSHADIRLVMGGVGTGKSTMLINELIMLAVLQKPDKHNKRSTRWLIVRETYPQLRNTIYESFKLWLKPNETTRRYTESAPMRIRWTDKLEDGTELNAEFIFMAVAKPQDFENLKSLELTGALINECGAMDYEIVTTVLSRLGRYPAPVDAIDVDNPITRVSLILDTNPPDDDGWVSEKFNATPRGWELWKQPPSLIKDATTESGYALNPQGENFKYLGVGATAYYLDKVDSMTPEQVSVLFCGNFGVTLSGKAIYRRQWSDDYHVAKSGLKAISGTPILLGWDWGRGGEACIVGQKMPNGQLRILHELVADNIGLHDFAKNFVRPLLDEYYPKDKFTIESVGDPAGVASHGLSQQGLNYFDVLNNSKTGVFRDWFTTSPALSNHVELRLNSVRHFLTEKTLTGAPLFQLNRDCGALRKGFNASYCYERKQVMGKAQFKDAPTKNDSSHPHDALQYLCLLAHPHYRRLVEHTEFVTRKTVDAITNY
jgi:hypothetical protein